MDLLQLLASLGIETTATEVSALTPDELTAAREAAVAAYAEAREARDLERCTALVDGIEAIDAESTSRSEAEAALDDQLAQLDGRLTEPETDEPETDEPEAPSTDSSDEPAATEESVETDERVPVAAAASLPLARTESRAVAAHAAVQNRAARRAAPMPTAPAAVAVAARRASITAGADLVGYSPGQAIPDMRSLGHAAAERIHALQSAQRGNPHMGGHFLVASAHTEYPEERTLGTDPTTNAKRIEAITAAARVQSMDAITAAGGLCAPVDVRYQIYTAGDDRRPIRDALVRFGANRGGVRFIAPPQLSSLASSVVVWTEANDTSPSSPATKPCTTITCGSETEEVIDAVTKCLKVGNFSRRTFPEQFAAWWELAGIEHAREAETQLWDRMTAGATQASTGQLLGAARDILENAGQAAAAYRSRRRIAPNEVLRLILPEWVIDMIQADLARQAPGDATLAVTRAQVLGYFEARNIALTLTPDTDQQFGAQTDGAALLRWPDTVEGLLFAEGTYLFLDGGQLDFGMEIRDSSLNASNDSQAFMETFEGVAFVGNEAINITMDVCPDGAASALVDINPCTTGS